MKKFLGLLCLAGVLCVNASEFKLDKAHTSVEFKVKHLMVSTTKGSFKNFDASMDFDEKSKEFKALNASVEVDSVDTNNDKRDKHIKAADFLNMQKYPQLTFTMNKYEKLSDNSGKMYGLLGINGVFKEVVFDVDINGVVDIGAKRKLGFDMRLKLNRKDFNVAKDHGDKTIGEEVEVNVFVEADKNSTI